MYDSNMTTSMTASEYANQKVASDVSPVSRQTTLIQKLLAEHKEVQGVVEQRLHAVLRPSGPAVTEQSNGSPRSVVSPMVSDLESFTDLLQRLLSDYQDILNRLEL